MKAPRIGVIGSGGSLLRTILGDKAPAACPVNRPVNRPVDIQGTCGKAWKADIEAGRRILEVPKENDSCLVHWVVEAPWAHPAWHSYSLLVVHLRPLDPPVDTLIYLDGATHELWLYAMNPDADREELIRTGLVRGHWLSPPNFCSQFIEIEDQLALDRVEATVRKIVDGELSPDTDHRASWIELYGNNMMKDRPHPAPPRIVR